MYISLMVSIVFLVGIFVGIVEKNFLPFFFGNTAIPILLYQSHLEQSFVL